MITSSIVWVVEQGSYSDYRVVGVFSSKENAQLVADAVNSGEYSSEKATVSEWRIDPAVNELRQGFRQFSVYMREDGSTERCWPWDAEGYDITGSVRIWRRSTAPAYIGKSEYPDILDATVWARDAEHAVKIANEHRLRLIASGEWAHDREPVK